MTIKRFIPILRLIITIRLEIFHSKYYCVRIPKAAMLIPESILFQPPVISTFLGTSTKHGYYLRCITVEANPLLSWYLVPRSTGEKQLVKIPVYFYRTPF